MKTLSNLAYQLTAENHEWSIAVIKKLIRNSNLKMSELEELKSAGVFGLIQAAQRYKPDGDCQFRSFAYKRIHGSLIDHVRRNTKDSRHIFQKQNDNDKPTSSSVTKKVDFEQISTCLMSSWLLNKEEQSPEESLQRKEIKALLLEALNQLPAREKELIFRHYFGEEDFKDIGQSWNKFSKSWLSKLHHQILDKLKEQLEAKGYQGKLN